MNDENDDRDRGRSGKGAAEARRAGRGIRSCQRLFDGRSICTFASIVAGGEPPKERSKCEAVSATLTPTRSKPPSDGCAPAGVERALLGSQLARRQLDWAQYGPAPFACAATRARIAPDDRCACPARPWVSPRIV